jgi:hypothetical protein
VAVNSIVLSDPGAQALGGSESSQKLTIPTDSSSSDQGDDESFSDDSPWSEESEFESAATNRYDNRPEAKAMYKIPQKDQREIPTLLRMISFLVVCLYRMPIRQFAVTEKIKARISDRASFYQHFDVLFVRDLFPKMDETAATNLGRSISQRRSILLYKGARDRQLEALNSGDSDSEPPAPAPAPNEIGTIEKTAIPKTLGQELAVSESKSVAFTLPSKATTYTQKSSQQSWLYPPSPSVAISKKSTVSDYAAQELAIAVPKMPVASSSATDDAFVCPYCYSPQRVMSEIQWEKHFFADIQPYVCTFSGCQLQNYLFTTRTQWWKHETEKHRFVWHCNTRLHQSYDSREAFKHHMHQAHRTSFTDIQLDDLKSTFRLPSDRLAGKCNLCFRHSKNLKSHISRHLQRIALFAIPRAQVEFDYPSQDAQESMPSHPTSDTITDCLKPINRSSAALNRSQSIASTIRGVQEERFSETGTVRRIDDKMRQESSPESTGNRSSELPLIVQRGPQHPSKELVASWLQREGVDHSTLVGMYHPFKQQLIRC